MVPSNGSDYEWMGRAGKPWFPATHIVITNSIIQITNHNQSHNNPF
jgi:hypothetical protein